MRQKNYILDTSGKNSVENLISAKNDWNLSVPWGWEIINNSKYLIDFGSRENAIKKAISRLQSDDLLLIAGKGHEDYQIIKNKKYKFSDKEIVKKYLRKYE